MLYIGIGKHCYRWIVGIALCAAVLASFAVLAIWRYSAALELQQQAELQQRFASTGLKIGLIGTTEVQHPTRRYTADGLEVGFASEIGAYLHLPIALVALTPEQASAALLRGEVDILLARSLATVASSTELAVMDTHFSAGLSVLLRSDTQVRQWSDLRGRVVCLTEANTQAQQLVHTLQVHSKTFAAPAQVLAAVRTGVCDAALHDQPLIDALRTSKEWVKFAATLPAQPATPLHLVITNSNPLLRQRLNAALQTLDRDPQWQTRASLWASNVAFEVFLDQLGPDCH